MKKIVLLSIISLFSFQLFSQDLIITKSEDSINCRILNVSEEKIEIEVIKNEERLNTFILSSTIKSIQKDYYSKMIVNSIGEEIIAAKKIENSLSQGDYLIKTANNIVYSTLFSVLASSIFIVGLNVSYDTYKILQIPAGICAGLSLVHFICIPINLNKAGKAANREKPKIAYF